MKKSWRSDLLLLGVFLVVGLVLALIAMHGKTGNQVEVRVSGKLIATWPLSEDRTCEIEGADGGTNLLVIENGTARISEASCPDGLCVNMGRISKSGQSIICLPNEVVVEVTGGDSAAEDDDGVDIITGGKQ